MTIPEPGVPQDITLVEALAELRAAGITVDHHVGEEGVRCGRCGEWTDPEHAAVERLRRLEGASDPGDEAAVAVVVCAACGAHGAVVLRYGPEAGAADAALLARSADARPEHT